MQIKSLLKSSEKFVTDNSPALLTAIGVVGTISTALLVGKATWELAYRTAAEDTLRHKNGQPMMNYKEVARNGWKLYIPALATAALTTGAIICANRVGTRRAAALATAYGVSEKAFGEYKEKVIEHIGENKERQIRDEVAQDRVRNNPSGDIFVSGSDETLQKFYDKYSGRYFASTMEDVKKAQNHLNHSVLNEGYASLNDFYSWVGLNTLPLGEEVGWNSDKLMEVMFSAIIDEKDKACIVVDFRVDPIRNYYKTHG